MSSANPGTGLLKQILLDLILLILKLPEKYTSEGNKCSKDLSNF